MFDKLFTAFTLIDGVIACAAVGTLIVLLYCLHKAGKISDYIAQWKRDKNPSFTRYLHDELAVAYRLFLTLISVFPLLGMFGTVMGLLNVDISGGMESVRANFFSALTSTAWGIIYSIVFKLVNAFFANRIETQIEESRRLAEELSAPECREVRVKP